jgi:hypothetical protein
METLRLSGPGAVGTTAITATALRRLELRDVHVALRRHARGNWGDGEDWTGKRRALLANCRVLSVRRDRTGQAFWIISEAGPRQATILLPEEF